VVAVSVNGGIVGRSSEAVSRTAGVLSRTPDAGYPVGPDPEPALGPTLDALARILRLEDELLVVVGGLLLLSGLAGLGAYGPFDSHGWFRSGRRAILGGIALVLPVVVILRALAWLATGEPIATQSIGIVTDAVSLPSERLQYELRPLDTFVSTGSGIQWLVRAGNRGRSLVAGIAVVAGSLAIVAGTVRYWWGSPSESSIDVLRSGLSVVVVVVLFSVVLSTTTWLATGSLQPGSGLGSGSTGVTTSFETGSMQGWVVESGSAGVSSGSGGAGTLRIDGAAERSFELGPVDARRTAIALDLDGSARVTITAAGAEVVSESVEGGSSWQIPTRSNVTIRVAGEDVSLQSVRVRPVVDSWTGLRLHNGRWSA
jgi:hypothetical protein